MLIITVCKFFSRLMAINVESVATIALSTHVSCVPNIQNANSENGSRVLRVSAVSVVSQTKNSRQFLRRPKSTLSTRFESIEASEEKFDFEEGFGFERRSGSRAEERWGSLQIGGTFVVAYVDLQEYWQV